MMLRRPNVIGSRCSNVILEYDWRLWRDAQRSFASQTHALVDSQEARNIFVKRNLDFALRSGTIQKSSKSSKSVLQGWHAPDDRLTSRLGDFLEQAK